MNKDQLLSKNSHRCDSYEILARQLIWNLHSLFNVESLHFRSYLVPSWLQFPLAKIATLFFLYNSLNSKLKVNFCLSVLDSLHILGMFTHNVVSPPGWQIGWRDTFNSLRLKKDHRLIVFFKALSLPLIGINFKYMYIYN